jgi:long-chain fatty acid transport protein
MKHKVFVVPLFILVLFCFTMTAFSSNGSQIGLVGARATAMGSNFIGLANDWSALYYNPAGLTQLQSKWTFGFSYGLVAPTGSFTPYQFFPYTVKPNPGLFSNEERMMYEQTFGIPSFGIFYKATERITVGLGVYAPFGLGAKFDLMEIPAGYDNDTPMDEYETWSDHATLNIQPTFAFQVTDKISIGASVGYMGLLNQSYMDLSTVGVPEYGLTLFGKEQQGLLPAGTYNMYQGLLAVLKGQTGLPNIYNTDHDRLFVENLMEGGDAHAYSFGFGLLFKPSDVISIGVSGRMYTDLKMKGTLTRKIHYPGSQTYINSLTPYFPYMSDADSAAIMMGLAGFFPGNTQTIVYDAEASLPLPMSLGAGLSITPSSKWTIVADVTWTGWASWDVIDITLDDQATDAVESDTLTMNEDWINTFQFGAGAEYRVLEKENMNLDLRVGAYTAKNPTPHSTISPTILDPKRRYILSAGVGLNIGKFNFSLAYEHAILGEENVKANEYVFDEALGNTNENWAGIYKMNANVITVAATINL